jgi:hypothetical protein
MPELNGLITSPAETFTAPDGVASLWEAFGDEPGGAPNDPPAADPKPVDTDSKNTAAGDTPASTPSTPAAPATPAAPDVLSNPLFQRTVDQQVQSRLADQERANRQAQYDQWLSSLDDDSYGKVMRRQQAEVSQYTNTRDAVAAQFAEQATRTVLEAVPELGKLSVEESAKVDPTKYDSYGKWVSAVADVIADRRADALAAKKLDAEVEAKVTERVAKLQKEYPKQITNRGSTAGEDLSKMSGTDLLRSAFS